MLRDLFHKLFGTDRHPPPPPPPLAPGDGQEAWFRHVRDQGQRMLCAARDANDLSVLEEEIRSRFSLHHRGQAARAERLALRQVGGLADVFVFHGDGRLREQALQQLDAPLTTAASVYGVIRGLNHWAPQVRLAALKAMGRVMPATPAARIAPALNAILPHMPFWGRWADNEAQALDAVLLRPDVAAIFLDDIKGTRRSGLGPVFRRLSKTPWIDPHIQDVFRSAPLPHIRAMALDMLLSRKARWPTGEMRRVWINRPLDTYRMEPVFAERALTLEPDGMALVAAAARDRSAMVRKRAADGLIAARHSPGLAADLMRIAAVLREDPNIGVRGRIDFLDRHWPAAPR